MDSTAIQSTIDQLVTKNDPADRAKVLEIYDLYLRDVAATEGATRNPMITGPVERYLKTTAGSIEDTIREARDILHARERATGWLGLQVIYSSVQSNAVIPEDELSVDLATGEVTAGPDGKWDPNPYPGEGDEAGVMMLRANLISERRPTDGFPTRVDPEPLVELSENDLDDEGLETPTAIVNFMITATAQALAARTSEES